jgi:hypothetical protein
VPIKAHSCLSKEKHKKISQKTPLKKLEIQIFEIIKSFKFLLFFSSNHNPYIINKLLYSLNTNWNTSIILSQFPLFITFNLNWLERFRNFQANVTIPLLFWGLKEAKAELVYSLLATWA